MKLYIAIFTILFTATSMLMGAEAPGQRSDVRSRVDAYFARSKVDKEPKAQKPAKVADATPAPKTPTLIAGIPEKLDLTQIPRVQEAQKELAKPVTLALPFPKGDCRNMCTLGCDQKWQRLCETISKKSQKEKDDALQQYSQFSILLAIDKNKWANVRCSVITALCAGANPNIERYYRLMGIEKNDYPFVEFELLCGANPNISGYLPGSYWESPFNGAQTIKMAELLVRYGGKIPSSAIYSAASKREIHENLIPFYLQQKIPVINTKKTPLHSLAAACTWYSGQLSKIERKTFYLLNSGISPTATTDDGQTAVDIAQKEITGASTESRYPNPHDKKFFKEGVPACELFIRMLREADAEQKRKGS